MNKDYSCFPRMFFIKSLKHIESEKSYKIKQDENLTIISFLNVLASSHELGESGIPKFSNCDVILVLLILCTICGSTQSLFWQFYHKVIDFLSDNCSYHIQFQPYIGFFPRYSFTVSPRSHYFLFIAIHTKHFRCYT